jgi:hypothetical protein
LTLGSKALPSILRGNAVDVEAAHHQGHIATASEFGLTMSLDEAYAKLPHFIGGPGEMRLRAEGLQTIVEELRLQEAKAA